MEYLIFAGAIIAMLVVVKILAWPLKKILGLLLNVAIGIALLFLFNMYLGGIFGILIPINWITALVVGILGIPGFIAVLLFCIIF